MKVYLLSIEELQEKIVSENACLQRLDSHRREKAEQMKAPNVRYLSIGAGLLLQLVGREERMGVAPEGGIEKQSKVKAENQPQIELFSVTQLLNRLEICPFVVEFTYVYSTKGKPQFADNLGGNCGFPFFNLSHSGKYVCCAVSDEEVGVDIQQMIPLRNFRVAERFFSEREQKALAACEERQRREQWFYELWVKKEAYAKLTGEGIGTGVSIDTMEAAAMAEPVMWQELEAPAGYCMAACSYRNTNVKEENK